MSNNDPLVSIIIPTYNRTAIIVRTLDSLLEQTYSNWECLVVDDGSEDSTESTINKYTLKDSRFRFFKRPYNRLKGANACRNYGFELSKGDYIIWFDSDDIMHPNFLESQIENLEKHNLNYSICKSKWLTIEGKLLDGFRSSELNSINPINDYIQFSVFWPINAVCYRRTFLDKHALQFDETLQQSQEYDFHVKVLHVDRNYGIVDRELITIVASEESISYSGINYIPKTESSLKVRKRFLANNKKYDLNISTKQFLLHDIHRIFQQTTMKRLRIISIYSAYIYLHSHLLDRAIFKKYFFKHVIPVISICISYNLFGIGYKLFKKSNTFKYIKK